MSRRLLVLGYVLALLALAFFVRQLWYERHTLQIILTSDNTLLGAFLLSSVLFATIYPLTAWASSSILCDLGFRVRSSILIAVLCVSQLARYIPGNIGQHIARGGMLAARGVAMTAVVTALGYEAVLAFVAASSIAAVSLLWNSGLAIGNPVGVIAVVGALALAAVFGLPLLAERLPARWPLRRSLAALREISRPTLLLCLLIYLVNCWLVGLGLALIAWSLPNVAYVSLLQYVGAFAVAWTAGFLVPGLPAGLGVRESILIVLLAPTLGMAPSLAIAALHRLSTTVADLIAAMIGFLLIWQERRVASRKPTAVKGNLDET